MAVNNTLWELPDVSANEKLLLKLTKQIRKLRWIGMDGEARRLQRALFFVLPSDAVTARALEQSEWLIRGDVP